MFEFVNNEKIYLPALYILVGIGIYYLLKSILDKITHNKRVDSKRKTVFSMFKNICKYLIIIFVILAILNVYGVNTTSIIASLGLVTVIIGLAFKDLATDFLSGIFIILDNEYTIGDFVEINGFKGEVISLGLRTTKLKGINGEVKIISNSAFKEVINYNLKEATLYLTLGVSYDIKIEELEEVLKSIENDILNIEEVTGNYKLLGIDEFAPSSINYLISVDVKPMTNLVVKRKINNLIKMAFDKNDIKIPYNKLDVEIRK